MACWPGLRVDVVHFAWPAWAIGTALELPVWLLCGFLIPLSLLPAWEGWGRDKRDLSLLAMPPRREHNRGT